MIICVCNRISSSQISQAIEDGAACWKEVHAYHGHEPNCGSCECHINDTIERESRACGQAPAPALTPIMVAAE